MYYFAKVLPLNIMFVFICYIHQLAIFESFYCLICTDVIWKSTTDQLMDKTGKYARLTTISKLTTIKIFRFVLFVSDRSIASARQKEKEIYNWQNDQENPYQSYERELRDSAYGILRLFQVEFFVVHQAFSLSSSNHRCCYRFLFSSNERRRCFDDEIEKEAIFHK